MAAPSSSISSGVVEELGAVADAPDGLVFLTGGAPPTDPRLSARCRSGLELKPDNRRRGPPVNNESTLSMPLSMMRKLYVCDRTLLVVGATGS